MELSLSASPVGVAVLAIGGRVGDGCVSPAATTVSSTASATVVVVRLRRVMSPPAMPSAGEDRHLRGPVLRVARGGRGAGGVVEGHGDAAVRQERHALVVEAAAQRARDVVRGLQIARADEVGL